MRFSRTLKTTLAVGATASLMMLGLGNASAHVTATPTETAAGTYSLVTFSVGHGCKGSSTTAVTITLPDELISATPTVNPNWTITMAQQKLDTPRTLANGSKVTERIASITYTAKTPLVDGQRDAFELQMKLPETAGTTLRFPALQECVVGQTDWKEIPAEGAGHDSVEAPAPAFTVTDAVAKDGHGGHGAAASLASSTDTAAAGGSSWPAWLGLSAGVAGLLLGGAAFWRTTKKA